MNIRYPFLASLAILAACSSGATEPTAPAEPAPSTAATAEPSGPIHAADDTPHHNAFMFQVQERLKHLGYYEGEVDGAMGPKTHAALRHFQHAKGLPVTGAVDQHTYSALGLSEGK